MDLRLDGHQLSYFPWTLDITTKDLTRSESKGRNKRPSVTKVCLDDAPAVLLEQDVLSPAPPDDTCKGNLLHRSLYFPPYLFRHIFPFKSSSSTPIPKHSTSAKTHPSSPKTESSPSGTRTTVMSPPYSSNASSNRVETSSIPPWFSGKNRLHPKH